LEGERLTSIEKAVMDCDEKAVVQTVQRALTDGVDPVSIVEKGLAKGALEVGEKFERGEVFLTDLVMAGEAMKAGMKLAVAKITEGNHAIPSVGKYIIGTAEGDIHDLGKNIVKTMLEVSGFQVTDLGVDVTPSRFIEKSMELKPHIVGVSALLTVSLEGQRKVVEELKLAGMREKVSVMVGGGPVNERWAREIGADGFAENALSAARMAKQLISENKRT
jgi:corrinoid protein of di/trimethylamine methyltransferase